MQIEFMAMTSEPDQNGFMVLDDIGVFGKLSDPESGGCKISSVTVDGLTTKSSTRTDSSSSEIPMTQSQEETTSTATPKPETLMPTTTTSTTTRPTTSTSKTTTTTRKSIIDICSVVPCDFEG